MNILSKIKFYGHFWKFEILCLGAKVERYQKSEITILYKVQFYDIRHFSITPYFKNEHYISLQTFAVILAEMAKHDVTKTLLSKKKTKSAHFSEIHAADIKLMLEKVLKVSRRYLKMLLSYRENAAGGGGGRICPLPAGRILKTAGKIGRSVKRLSRTFIFLFVNTKNQNCIFSKIKL